MNDKVLSGQRDGRNYSVRNLNDPNKIDETKWFINSRIDECKKNVFGHICDIVL